MSINKYLGLIGVSSIMYLMIKKFKWIDFILLLIKLFLIF